MNSLLLAGGRVIDPANALDSIADVLHSKWQSHRRRRAGRGNSRRGRATNGRERAGGLPRELIDLHVHLRIEPGQAAKETIATGTSAAARGGFTSVVCMPNTAPAIDNSGTVALIHDIARASGHVNVFVTGAISKNIEGEELAPVGSLKDAGVVAITDDGHCVQNNELMRRALDAPGCSTCL